MPATAERAPLAEDRAAGETALLVIDMIGDWSFPDGSAVLAAAWSVAPAIAALRGRCRAAGVPVIYVNDNRGRWRSDFRAVFAAAQAARDSAAELASLLEPAADDYVVLKVKHSAFHATPLDLLLRHLRARRLIVTGVSAEQCVLYTVADARMHDYEVFVPHDAVASHVPANYETALRHIRDVQGVATPAAADLALPAATGA